MKRFRCCFPNCKFKHTALIVVISHLAKEHKLKINHRDLHIRHIYAEELAEPQKNAEPKEKCGIKKMHFPCLCKVCRPDSDKEEKSEVEGNE